MKIRRPVALGLTGALTIGAGGYFGLLMPQQDSTAKLSSQVQSVNSAAAATRSKLPGLKSQLASISGDVNSLRSLSAKVPAKLDMPALLQMLQQVAGQAGVNGVQNVTVTAPVLVKTTQGSANTASTGSAAADSTTATSPTPAPSASATPAPKAAAGAGGSAVIASYDVSMQVNGTVGQELAFLDALRDAQRLSVVASTSNTVDKTGAAIMQLRATCFLQQVDVEGLAQAIEALSSKSTAVSAGKPASSPTGTSTSAPTAVASTGSVPVATGTPVPSPTAS